MRIALAQLNPTSGDIDGNTAKIIDAITAASVQGADVVVTPEMAIPGYCIGDLVEDAGFLAANERALQRIAKAATSLTAVVGFIDHDPSARNDSGTILKHNAAAVISRGVSPRMLGLEMSPGHHVTAADVVATRRAMIEFQDEPPPSAPAGIE